MQGVWAIQSMPSGGQKLNFDFVKEKFANIEARFTMLQYLGWT